VANVIPSKIAAIILAAGSSSRLGQPKQLLSIDGKSLIARAADTALQAGCQPVIVVTGSGHDAILTELNQFPVKIVLNTNWSLGIGSSLRAAMAELLNSHPDITGTVILVCDQPLLTPAVLQSLIQSWAHSGQPMAACRYANTLGPPCCFAREKFPAISHINNSYGAKHLLLTQVDKVSPFDWPDGRIDLDTPHDLRDFSQIQPPTAKPAHNLPC
jgi:molybdenum cofactor cytidylyltransferase